MRKLLALVVVLAACGGGGGGGSSNGALEVRVATPDPLRVGEVTWVVTIANGTDDDVVLEFGSGQRADVSLSRDGETAYTWSAARSFIQVVGEETVPAGDELAFELDDVLEVDPGEYELTATVTSTSRPRLTVTRQVTVGER